MRTFACFSASRDNNFTLVRFLAASLVIISHSFALSLGRNAPEPPSRLLGVSFGQIGVYVFFTVSGFLIAMSYSTRRNLMGFLWARSLRIFPALIVCSLLLVLMGLSLTSSGTSHYLRNPSTYKYFANNTVLIPLGFQETLPGVFTNNPIQQVVNGSLWTLPIELRMYLLTALIGLLGLFKRKWMLTVGILGCLVSFVVIMHLFSFQALTYRLVMFFLAGTVFYLNKDFIPSSALVPVSLCTLAAVLWKTEFFGVIASVLLAYGTLWFAYLPVAHLRWFNAVGDYSYGLYIYSFPVQQLIVAAWPGTKPASLFAISFPITLTLAVASWHLIEKPSLRLKDISPFNLCAVMARLREKGRSLLRPAL